MPSSSRAEHNLMEAAAHNPAVAKKRGISQDTAREIVAADKGRDLSKLPAHAAAHKEPDRDERGGKSDMDKDDRTKCPMPMHKSHDAPTRCPTPKHSSHDAPMHNPGPRQGQRRGY